VLATLVIGLREGLEAALIVGILAAFLRRNGRSLRAMWIGVVIAIILSIAVGTLLEVVSLSLPQAQQEGLETVIGSVAVVFVTGMIAWMNTHAAGLKKEIESSATAALGEGTAVALAVMAFLAVLKEGFETSVFLLATFQSSTSVVAAIGGAVIGILIAVGIGIGIYYGGVKLNLGRFFRITGIFLVFVAAGLVLSALRTAHEAGWINVGQQTTVDLSWLAPNGSIQSALITGVLGIPADPRLIEALGWSVYLITVLLIVLWPASRRPSAAGSVRLKLGIAASLVVAAAVLGLAVPLATPASGVTTMPIAGASGSSVGEVTMTGADHSARFVITLDGTRPSKAAGGRVTDTMHDGVDAVTHSLPVGTSSSTGMMTIDRLVALNGGSLPIGMSLQQNPGPFTVTTVARTATTLWTVGTGILDARSTATTILQISGGGLTGTRTVSLADDSWAARQSTIDSVVTRITGASAAEQDRLLWKLYLPTVMLIAALALALWAWRGWRRLGRAAEKKAATAPNRADRSSTTAHDTRSSTYVPH
jgi:high-affinity iron transporter